MLDNAGIVFGRAEWAPWAIGLGVVLLVLSALSYRRSTMPLGWRCLGWSLRALGIASLLFCWLEPMSSRERPKPQANTIVVAVDNSSSLKPLVEDGRDPQWERLIADDAEWMVQASADFRVRKYLFDNTIMPVESLTGWTGEGLTSPIRGTLQSLRERYRGQPLAGIVLLTDGQSTDRESIATDGASTASAPLDVPVFPVRIGTAKRWNDVRIDRVTVNQSEFETAPVTLVTAVAHSGFAGRDAVVDLVDRAGKTTASQTVRLDAASTPKKVEFRFRPEAAGVSGYSVRVRIANANPEDEVTQGNNTRYVVVDRGLGPYRILYLAGRPNWEFKFLRRALDEDAELSLTSLIRIANREMKFSFRNSKLESSNPLFSGFEDISDEEKQQYDEPVYARLGVRESGELQKGFPRDAEELFEYTAIIVDDLEHSFLTQDQQQLIRQFVAVRGGALIALGGQEAMRGEAFRDSVLGQLLPVYGDTEPAQWEVPQLLEDAPETIHFRLTREGWLQPFMRLADTEEKEKKRLEGMPEFQVFNRTPRIKPGAVVLAATENEQRPIPLFVSQRFGRGLAASFMLGDFWRWGLRYDGDDRSPIFQAWRQIIRASIANVPRRIEASVDPAVDHDRLEEVRVRVFGPDFQAMDQADIQVTIEQPDGTTLNAVAQPSDQRVGEFMTAMVDKDPGVYIASVTARSEDGSLIGNGQTGWVYEPAAAEFAELGFDSKSMERLAEETGGRVLDPEDLATLTSWFTPDRIPVTEVNVVPVWHQPWVLGLAFLCLMIEWAMRRRYGLA